MMKVMQLVEEQLQKEEQRLALEPSEKTEVLLLEMGQLQKVLIQRPWSITRKLSHLPPLLLDNIMIQPAVLMANLIGYLQTLCLLLVTGAPKQDQML